MLSILKLAEFIVLVLFFNDVVLSSKSGVSCNNSYILNILFSNLVIDSRRAYLPNLYNCYQKI